MKIKVNGKEEEVSGPVNISELLIKRGLRSEHVVVEHNCRIVPKEELDLVSLGENDSLEIITFVGGG
jgi:thiamine biosynthesis protein ThiS